MNIDFNKIRDDYRKSYNLFKKTKGQVPDSNIDYVETYIIRPEQGDYDLFRMFEKGMTQEGFKPYYSFIGQNMPIDNLKVIIIDNLDDYRLTTFCICANGEAMAVRHETEERGGNKQMVASYLAIASLYNTLKDISSNSIYVSKKNIDYVSKRTGRIIPNKIVFFSREKKEKTICGESFSKIDWRHSWSVVGHWRRVKRIGKNRIGEYAEIGRTWVSPSVKGSGDFIRKIRYAV